MQTRRAETRRWSVGRRGLAVLAAGAGLGAAMEAEGGVIHTDLVPDVVVQNSSFAIDLNGDAITDFTLADPSLVQLQGPATSQVMGATGVFPKAFALPPGSPIGPAESFIGLPAEVAFFWGDGTNAYLGLEFDISGSTHFGWAHVQTSYPADVLDASATLFSYAYCDQPNQGLLAGQTDGACSTGVPLPSALALLAVGAGAVLALRRREDSAG